MLRMPLLTDKDRGFLGLVKRSPVIDDEWREVSDELWPLVLNVHPKLIELDEQNKRVRLSPDGEILYKWLTNEN